MLRGPNPRGTAEYLLTHYEEWCCLRARRERKGARQSHSVPW